MASSNEFQIKLNIKILMNVKYVWDFENEIMSSLSSQDKIIASIKMDWVF